ncbi:GNAT family N-acetyltransferase [Oricola sp.]|uniref:GNAT family N-acetyltransferase n=1 Tax=Oricola sp. TaxID=1979950 RepID=UPI0025EEB6B3|nr:GNAT family N-acetyltransferase [Oricola sp.]MCI5074372.1 GNAT family N-acetyltransferase [Oricola sp.]
MTEKRPICRRAGTREDMDACLAIRETVFQHEQAVDPAIERDGREGEAIHYLAELDGRPVAAARARLLDDRIKIERVAVLKDMRGRRIGEALMRFMMGDLGADPDNEGRHFFLSSQSQAAPFYERLGFAICSPDYFEAGIAHCDMRAEPRDVSERLSRS